MIYILIKRIEFKDFFEYFKMFLHLVKIFLNFNLKFKFVMDRNIDDIILGRRSKQHKIDIFIKPHTRINLIGLDLLKDLSVDSISNKRIVITDLIFVHAKSQNYIHLPSYSPELIRQFNYLKFLPVFLSVHDNKVLLELYKFVTSKSPLSNHEINQTEIIKLNTPLAAIRIEHKYNPVKVLEADHDFYSSHFQFNITWPRISIIVPSALHPELYKNGEFKLIEQVFQLEDYLKAEFEVIIVVGPEVDKENLIQLRKHYSRLVLVEDETEFNFSKRVNIGIKKSTNEVLWILNDDIELKINEFMHEDFQLILELLGRNDTGLVGTFLVDHLNEINHAGIEIKFGIADHFLRGTNFSKRQALNFFKVREVIGVTGANAFLRKSKTELFGLFNEYYPMNFNDLEICLRFRSHKLVNYVIRSSNFIHLESQTRNRKILENDKLFEILSYYGKYKSEDDFKFYLPNCCLHEYFI